MELLSELNKRRFGDDYVRELIKAIRSSNKSASGKLINSIDYRLTDEAEAIRFIFDAEKYFEYVDQGRKPGSYPNISELTKWANIRGISKDAVFPIANKIYKFGIRPANIFEKANNNVLNGVVFDNLEKGFANDVEELVFNELEKLNKQI